MSEQYIVIFTPREQNKRLTCQFWEREKEDSSKTMERQEQVATTQRADW